MSDRNIFVIYTTRDELINLDILKQIEKELKNYGEVFIDLIHNISNEKQKFVIQKLIESTDIVIVETPMIAHSKWVEIELNIVKELKKPILGRYIFNEVGCLTFLIDDNQKLRL